MTAATDAVERDSDGLEYVLPAGKFGWPTACARREGVTAWIHIYGV
jgi:hypothetical protein